mgnify:CR=1 FL=1
MSVPNNKQCTRFYLFVFAAWTDMVKIKPRTEHLGDLTYFHYQKVLSKIKFKIPWKSELNDSSFSGISLFKRKNNVKMKNLVSKHFFELLHNLWFIKAAINAAVFIQPSLKVRFFSPLETHLVVEIIIKIKTVTIF